MRIRLVRPPNSTSADVLERLLRERGVELARQDQVAHGLVSWGVRVEDPELPCLNANGGMGSKLEQLQQLKDADVPVPPFGEAANLHYPMFARRLAHTGGRDLIPALGPSPLDDYLRREFDYFTEFVPHRRELRAWVYRNRRLGVYEKVLRYPRRLHGVAQNWTNGYAFEFVPEPPPTLIPVAGRAVDALDLDFGAVDLLETLDGGFVVLEVNTRPGVEEARAGIANLATKIARWVDNGFLRRRNAE